MAALAAAVPKFRCSALLMCAHVGGGGRASGDAARAALFSLGGAVVPVVEHHVGSSTSEFLQSTRLRKIYESSLS